MHLKDFSEERIFIDSNILIYASSKEHSLKSVCEDFLLKIENGKILGFINGRIVDEVFHKLMIIEISKKYKINFKDTLQYIKVNPEVLKKFKKPKISMYSIFILYFVLFGLSLLFLK